MRHSIVVWLMTALLLLSACASNQSRFAKQEKGDPAKVNTQLVIEYMREGMNEAAMEKFRDVTALTPEYLWIGAGGRRVGRQERCVQLCPDTQKPVPGVG